MNDVIVTNAIRTVAYTGPHSITAGESPMADGEYLIAQDARGRTPEKGPPVPQFTPVGRTVTAEDERAKQKRIDKRRAKKKYR